MSVFTSKTPGQRVPNTARTILQFPPNLRRGDAYLVCVHAAMANPIVQPPGTAYKIEEVHFTFWDRTGPGVPPAELARPNTGTFAVYAAQVGPRVALDPLAPPGVYLLVHARQAALAVAKVSIRYSWRHREKTYYAEAETHNQLTRGFRSMTETVFLGKTGTFLRRLMLLGERHNNQDWKGTVKGMLEAMGKGDVRTAWCSGGEPVQSDGNGVEVQRQRAYVVNRTWGDAFKFT